MSHTEGNFHFILHDQKLQNNFHSWSNIIPSHDSWHVVVYSLFNIYPGYFNSAGYFNVHISLRRGRIIYDDKSIFQFVLLKKTQSGQARLLLNLKSASNNNLENNKNKSYRQINKTKQARNSP